MMNRKTVITGVLVDENQTAISFTQVCHAIDISEEELMELLEHGLFDELSRPYKKLSFSSIMLERIQAARRLQDDLGVNLPGVVLALELRDELEKIRHELEILRRHLSLP